MHVLLTFACIGIFGLSGTTAKNFRLFERLHSAPEGWRVVKKPLFGLPLGFSIAVKEAHGTALEKRLYDVSTPGNALYGKHLSREDLYQYTRPTRESVNTVIDWLKQSGVEKIKTDNKGEWIHFSATADQANQMMNANFKVYRHGHDKDSDLIRTTEIYLPQNILPRVKMIHPTTRFVQPRAQRDAIHDISDIIEGTKNSRTVELDPGRERQEVCRKIGLEPKCVRKLYRIGDVRKVNGSPNLFTVGPLKVDSQNAGHIGIPGFLGGSALYSDFNQFVDRQLKEWKGVTFNWTSINNGTNDQNSTDITIQANGDTQWSTAIGYPVPIHFYSTGGRGLFIPDLDNPNEDTNEPFVEFFAYLLNQTNPPHTVVVGYGESEQTVPASYAKQVCDMIRSLGARGVSVIVAGGDRGVGSACLTNDGSNRTRFRSGFPATCPYVTSVGGTFGTVPGPETARKNAGGGFSEIWARPEYQEVAVSSYLKTLGSKWSGYYNPNGRGYPDVAAQSEDAFLVDKGRARKLGGSSTGAAIISGLVGLLNAHRIQLGQAPLGFLNPWLYERGSQMFTDIVNGASTGCIGNGRFAKIKTPRVEGAGWAAVKGWDPVTGMGSPLFDKMIELLPKASGAKPAEKVSPATAKR